MNEKRFVEIVKKASTENERYLLELAPIEVTALHGAVALAMRHPIVKGNLTAVYPVLGKIRKELCMLMRDMGFTDDEVEDMDKTEI